MRQQTPDQVRAFFEAHRTIRDYQVAEDGSPLRLSPDELDAVLYAAQRAPTDATAQLYTIVHVTDAQLRAQLAELTKNAHIATASEAFVLCLDVRRVKQVLEVAGYAPGQWPTIAVHFGVGDAVLAGQNLLTAAEMLGYQGCWIGGVLTDLPHIVDLLGLPAEVLPFSALTIGKPASDAPYRPRLPRELVVHENRYRDATPAELQAGATIMNPIAARAGKPGDWAKLLNWYFGKEGSMEGRDEQLAAVLRGQGLMR